MNLTKSAKEFYLKILMFGKYLLNGNIKEIVWQSHHSVLENNFLKYLCLKLLLPTIIVKTTEFLRRFSFHKLILIYCIFI
jgi:hypothetical protein